VFSIGIECNVFLGERIVDRVVEVHTAIVDFRGKTSLLFRIQIFFFLTASKSVEFLGGCFSVCSTETKYVS
jgi:uncharacterized Tic20 family protein